LQQQNTSESCFSFSCHVYFDQTFLFHACVAATAMLKQKELCGGSAVADCAKEAAAEEALSAQAAQFSQHWHPSS
jgi:hypothetical protein